MLGSGLVLQRAARKSDNLARASFRCVELLADVNHRPTKIVADLELDKLILKESLDFLKPKA